MRIVSVRARTPDSSMVVLHRRLTVILGAPTEDRAALRSTFGALTGSSEPALDAVVEVAGRSEPLTSDFADRHGLRGVPGAVVSLPTSESVDGRTRPARVDAPSAAPVDLPHMVAVLRAAVLHGRRRDAMALADRLERLAERRSTARAREAALEQLMVECRTAMDSAREALEEMSRNGGLGARADGTPEPHESVSSAQLAARLELLDGLTEHWDMERELLARERSEEARARAEAEEFLDDATNGGAGSRIIAARLRSGVPRVDVAQPPSERAPKGLASSPIPDAATNPSASAHAGGQRPESHGQAGATSTPEDDTGGTGAAEPGASAAGALATLDDELQLRRSVAGVGGLPVLVDESMANGNGSALPDTWSVAAQAATLQVVWLTDRHEVADALAQHEELATVIRV